MTPHSLAAGHRGPNQSLLNPGSTQSPARGAMRLHCPLLPMLTDRPLTLAPQGRWLLCAGAWPGTAAAPSSARQGGPCGGRALRPLGPTRSTCHLSGLRPGQARGRVWPALLEGPPPPKSQQNRGPGENSQGREVSLRHAAVSAQLWGRPSVCPVSPLPEGRGARRGGPSPPAGGRRRNTEGDFSSRHRLPLGLRDALAKGRPGG